MAPQEENKVKQRKVDSAKTKQPTEKGKVDPAKTKQPVKKGKADPTKKKQPAKKGKGKGPRRHERREKNTTTESKSIKMLKEYAEKAALYIRSHWIISTCVVVVLAILIKLYNVDTLDLSTLPQITERVTFNFAVNGRSAGFVEFGLFGALCPLTVKNFVMLSTHEKGYGYKGSRIYNLIPNKLMLGGDLTKGNGLGGRSALDEPFDGESFEVRHSGPGLLGMLNMEDNKDSVRSSIFYITLGAMPQMDRSNVIFGVVTRGMDIIKKLGQIKVNKKMVPVNNISVWHASYEAYSD